MAVVTTVAEAEGVSPLDLEPLVWATDTETVETLMGHGCDERVIVFEYMGYEVTVERSDEVTVTVTPASTPRGSH